MLSSLKVDHVSISVEKTVLWRLWSSTEPRTWCMSPLDPVLGLSKKQNYNYFRTNYSITWQLKITALSGLMGIAHSSIPQALGRAPAIVLRITWCDEGPSLSKLTCAQLEVIFINLIRDLHLSQTSIIVEISCRCGLSIPIGRSTQTETTWGWKQTL